jgi:hypothetical protein
MAHKGMEADARHWAGKISRQYRMLLLEEGAEKAEKTREVVDAQGDEARKVVRKGMAKETVAAELASLEAGRDVALRQMLRWKVRYFTDGAAIGSRAFVDGLFEQCRDRFGPKRQNGARRLRGKAAGASGAPDLLWSARDLRMGTG